MEVAQVTLNKRTHQSARIKKGPKETFRPPNIKTDLIKLSDTGF